MGKVFVRARDLRENTIVMVLVVSLVAYLFPPSLSISLFLLSLSDIG